MPMWITDEIDIVGVLDLRLQAQIEKLNEDLEL